MGTGATGHQAQTRAGLSAGEIWTLWRRVVRALPMITMPFETLFAPSAWSLWGVDYLSGLRRNKSTQRIFDLLAPLAPDDLRRMHALAQINHRRHEAVSRWMAVSSITLPVSAALALSQLAPELLDQIRREWFDVSVTTLVAVAAIVGFYLVAAWRARQLAILVELAFVERGLALDAASSEADLEPPVVLEA